MGPCFACRRCLGLCRARFARRAVPSETWASRELNPDPLRDRILSPARLPVPPLALRQRHHNDRAGQCKASSGG